MTNELTLAQLDSLINQGIKAYDQHLAEQKAQAEAQAQAKAEAAARERAELLKFLATIMPEELTRYVNISNFRKADAQYWNYDSDRHGTCLTLSVPSCFPIYFWVYLDGDEYEHVDQSMHHRHNGTPAFYVPERAEVKFDDYGDQGHYIHFIHFLPFEDFNLALGYAAVRGPDLIPLEEKVKVKDRALESEPTEPPKPKQKKPTIPLEDVIGEQLAASLVNQENPSVASMYALQSLAASAAKIVDHLDYQAYVEEIRQNRGF